MIGDVLIYLAILFLLLGVLWPTKATRPAPLRGRLAIASAVASLLSIAVRFA